ncbi:MAG: outer rane lipoproteinsorting protein [Gammaproteobacteria bacterium]|nr:outer rane lipoproteinsorting protein [Gammaproteobacteria bacterium]
MKTFSGFAAAALLLAGSGWAGSSWAAVSPQDAARLGADLTPLGAEKAGNTDGTIPEWTGGIRSPAEAGFPNYRTGEHHPDPYASDKPLFTITPANLSQYAAKLTEGHKKLLQTYPDYKIVVYPAHRSAAQPQRIYDATKRIATTANLVPGGNGVTGAAEGIPFPIPKQGIEVFWNHVLRYRADAVLRSYGQAPVTAGGSYTLVQFKEDTMIQYSLPGATEAGLNNIIAYFIQETTQPARLAGEILLVHETLDQTKENRRAWIYNPGQRRVRRAPNVAFDNPGTNADNLRTSDQLDMYNGSPERYDWKLIGKKEIYVPYNSYKLHGGGLKYADVLKKNHINQDLARYELHRVWVVDSTLKPGTSHLYSRRTLYVDEDSWQILAVDCYDRRGELFRVQEGHVINYYELPVLWTTLELVMDLSNGRYLALGLQNEEPRTYDFTIKRTPADYQPNVLQLRGVR